MVNVIKITEEACGGVFHNLEDGSSAVIVGLGDIEIPKCQDILAFKDAKTLDVFIKSLKYLKERIEEDNVR